MMRAAIEWLDRFAANPWALSFTSFALTALVIRSGHLPII
jgi:hypothetical protein